MTQIRKKLIALVMALMMCTALTVPASLATNAHAIQGTAWDLGTVVYEFLPDNTVYYYSTGGSSNAGYGGYTMYPDNTGFMEFTLENKYYTLEYQNNILYIDGYRAWYAGAAHVGAGGTFTEGIGIHSIWADRELDAANTNGLIPDSLSGENLRENINRSEFASVAVRLYEAFTGEEAPMANENPFWDVSDTDSEDILKAYALGIVNGTSATTFSPWNDLTREQASTMMARAYTAAFSQDLEYTMSPRFRDHNAISRWAKPSVYFMANNNVLNGIGNNTFAPRHSATREQGIVIAYRALTNLG